MFLVYDEALAHNNHKLGASILDVYIQIPFFANINIFLDTKFQSDIRRFSYTKDTGTPPYSGGYGDTPKIWIEI